MSSQVIGGLVAAAIGVGASPYLAGLTRTAPERDDRRWWRPTRGEPRRIAATAFAVVVLGGLGGAAAQWGALLPAFVVLALAGAPLVVIDFERHRLPSRLVYPLAIIATALFVLAAAVTSDWRALLRAAEAAAAVFAVLFALNLVSPRSFGMGDVRLGGIVAGYLGWFGWGYVYYGIFAGFVLGALVAVVLLAIGRANRRTPVPFGPMLLLGPLVVLVADLVPSALV